MGFCPKCGQQVADGTAFCNRCGTPINNSNPTYQAQPQSNASQKLGDILNTKDTTYAFNRADIENNKILALFSYIGPLVLVPLLAARDSAYARYHANQGLILLIAGLVVSVAEAIIGWVLGGIPVIGTIWSIITWVISVLMLALAVIGVVNAIQGKAKELPLIGKFRIIK